MIHFHKWVNDSQGAIYCIKCNKFKGWMEGSIEKCYIPGIGEGIKAWGYVLNGEEWKKRKELEIELNGGKYY